MSLSRKAYIYPIALTLIILFHFMNNLIILQADEVSMPGHNGANYVATLMFYDILMKNPFMLYSVTTYYPPFFMLFPIPFLALFGKTPLVAMMSNMIYFFILVFSTYGIGKHIHNKKAGLLAAFIVSMSPSIYGFSRMYWPDFPLAAITTLSIFLFLKTDLFKNRKYSILFGISTGIGMLTKWNFILYLIFPLVTLIMFKKNKERMHVKNLVLSCFTFLAIIFPWYFKNLNFVIEMTSAGQKSFLYVAPYLNRLLENLKFIYYIHLYPVYSILFVTCFFLFIFLKRYVYKIFILTWLFSPLFLLSLLAFQTPRYTLSIVPPIALLISITVFELKTKYFKTDYLRFILIFLIVVAGLVQFFYLCYGIKPKGFFTANEMAAREELTGLLHPEKVTWEINSLMGLLEENSKGKTHLMLTTHTSLPLVGIVFSEIQIRKLPIRFDNIMGCLFGTLTTCSPEKYYDFVSDATFVLTQECDDGSLKCRDMMNQNPKDLELYYLPFMKIFESQKDEFQILKKINLGDNSTAVVYYRVKEHYEY